MRIACLLLWYERFYLQSSKERKILSILKFRLYIPRKIKLYKVCDIYKVLTLHPAQTGTVVPFGLCRVCRFSGCAL